MKHFERMVFGAYVIAIITFISALFTWKILSYILGVLVSCYVIGFVLDKTGIIRKLKLLSSDDTQEYDDC